MIFCRSDTEKCQSHNHGRMKNPVKKAKIATKEPTKSALEAGQRVILLEGLGDLQQASIARDYEARTGRAFRCQPCLETGRSHSLRVEAEADEPGNEVVAILEESAGPVPLCEDCYRRLMDSTTIL